MSDWIRMIRGTVGLALTVGGFDGAADTTETEEDMEKMAAIAEKVGEKLETRPDQDEMLKNNEHILNPTGRRRVFLS